MKEIKTLNSEIFKLKHMLSGKETDGLLKADYNPFFIYRVEEMFRLIMLPVPPMRMPGHSLLFLKSGEANMNIGLEKYTLSAGEILVVPAGQIFSFDQPDVNTGYICNFPNEFLIDKNFQFQADHFPFLDAAANHRINDLPFQEFDSLFENLDLEYTARGLQRISIVKSWLILILQKLNYECGNLIRNPSSTLPGHFIKFKQLLGVSFKEQHRVSFYADKLNMSPGHLNKVIRDASGKSPSVWIEEMLLLETKAMLAQTDFSIQQIALSLGFLDQSYFGRFFKKHTGVSASAYRKRSNNTK